MAKDRTSNSTGKKLSSDKAITKAKRQQEEEPVIKGKKGRTLSRDGEVMIPPGEIGSPVSHKQKGKSDSASTSPQGSGSKERSSIGASQTPDPEAPKNSKTFRDRNLGIIKVRVGDLVEHPSNFRQHSDEQKQVFGEIVKEVGFYGTPHVFLNRKGKYQLIDGHMRREYLIEEFGEDTEIEVNLTDLTADEALVALVSHDAIGGMAGNDPEKIAKLMDDLEDAEAGVGRMLDELAAKVGLSDGEAPDEFPEVDEDIKTDHECPDCGYCWSGATGG